MIDEIREILDYLQNRNDYLIWAGFAQHAHLGLDYSPDIDIYTPNRTVKEEISRDFQKKGWQLMSHPEMSPGWFWDKLQRGETTLDVVFTEASTRLMFPDAIKLETEGYSLRFVSKEWLFITKSGQLSWSSRTEEKRSRDVKTINLLRKTIDAKKLRKIAATLPDSYWLRGEV